MSIHRAIQLVFENGLPVYIRNERVRAMKELPVQKRNDPSFMMREFWSVYRNQAKAGFNRYAFVAEMALTIFCFGASSLPMAQAVFLAAVFCALAYRNAYTHHDLKFQCNSTARYYLDSAADAAVAGLSLLTAEALMLYTAPEVALPRPAFYRGALVCLPLIAIMRVVLRPKPDPRLPFSSKMPAEKIYKKIWRLNIMWMGALNGMSLLTMTHQQNSLVDFLRGLLPMMTMGAWMGLQRNALRRDEFITLGRYLYDQKSQRMSSRLLGGLQKHEALYGWYVALEGLIFVQIAASMVTVLRPWLTGGATDSTAARPAAAILGFAALAMSWIYVKRSNREAALALG
jgi:hypothetical protein